MKIPETLQERVRVLSSNFPEALKKAGAYTLFAMPKLVIAGGGGVIGYGIGTDDYYKVIGGGGLIILGKMADIAMLKMLIDTYRNQGFRIYQFDEPQDDESKNTLNGRL